MELTEKQYQRIAGVLERVYAALTTEGLTDTEVYSLDSTAVKVHSDAQGARRR